VINVPGDEASVPIEEGAQDFEMTVAPGLDSGANGVLVEEDLVDPVLEMSVRDGKGLEGRGDRALDSIVLEAHVQMDRERDLEDLELASGGLAVLPLAFEGKGVHGPARTGRDLVLGRRVIIRFDPIGPDLADPGVLLRVLARDLEIETLARDLFVKDLREEIVQVLEVRVQARDLFVKDPPGVRGALPLRSVTRITRFKTFTASAG
jgi:hypothetical protein